MKKIVITLIAVMMMAFATVPAFAVASPEATCPQTPVPVSPCQTSVCTPDKGGTSPKTGSGDVLAYGLLAVAFMSCSVASVALVRSAKKN